MYANILITNGKCISMDENKTYDWIAVTDDKIVAMGHGDDYKNQIETYNQVIDAKGCSVLPGFIDSHFHMVQTAINRNFVNLSEAKCFQDICDLIRAEGKIHPDVNIHGIGVDEGNLKEKRLPNRHELDEYWNNSSVWLNTCVYQTSVLNTYGLLYYKIPFTKIGVECDEKNMPTGIFRGNANALLRNNILNDINDFYRLEALKQLMPVLAAQGLTTANAMEGGYVYSDKDAMFINDVINDKLVYLDMKLFFQTQDLELIQKMGLKRVGCFYVDGTFSTRTAAMSFGYKDANDSKGTLYFTQEHLNEFVEACYKRNLQLSLYTVGDRAIDMALKAHERAVSLTGDTSLRHRLEHAELPTKEHIAKAREMGIIFSMQPSYESKWGGPNKMYADKLGVNYEKTNPFKEILDGTVKICGGSDSDSTEVNYVKAISDAVNHPVSHHRVSTYDAIKMFTSDGAYAISEDNRKGYLKDGFLADIVILDGDIIGSEPDKIKDIKVTTTIKSGNIVYANGLFLADN